MSIEWSQIIEIEIEIEIEIQETRGCLMNLPFYFIKQFSSPTFVSKVVVIFTTTSDTLNAVS